MTRIMRPLVGLLAMAVLMLGFGSGRAQSAGAAVATLKDPSGQVGGYVRIAGAGNNRVVIQAVITGAPVLTPGFHGFHIHTTGRCVAPTFSSAGGHLAHPEGHAHGHHAGDMPSLLVKDDHRALLVFETDRALLDRILDADGAAVVVHAGPDNFANIPSRYGTPDEVTLATGDAGARALCGELR